MHDALEAAEQTLGRVVEQYRLALGCCVSCGDLFEIGALAIAMTDEKDRICFEHEKCPEEPVNYRDSYQNPQQNGPLGPSST